jgi:hypothetical protein
MKTQLLLLLLSLILHSTYAEVVDAVIYADNQFQFYVDGVHIKTDPLDFTPHNAVKFNFTTTAVPRTYAILAKDFSTASGFEYTSNNPQLGDGALRIIFSDGTVSSSKWKCFTTYFGPTDDSYAAGCNATNLDKCACLNTTEPTGWKLAGFDDSGWAYASNYTEGEAGWGMTPSYTVATGLCGKQTDPLTRGVRNPEYVATLADECIDPKIQTWGTSVFIWGSDLKRDNTILCRYTYTGSGSVTSSSSASGSSSSASASGSTASTASASGSTSTTATSNATTSSASASASASSSASASATSSKTSNSVVLVASFLILIVALLF